MTRKEYLFFFVLFVLLYAFRLNYGFENTFKWDVFGYYLYLPSTFIYNDLLIIDKSWFQAIFDLYNPSPYFYQGSTNPDTSVVFQYTMGSAVMMSPFFFIGHLIASFSSFPADGFSLPYQISVVLGSIFYSCLGLIFLFKILKKFFSSSRTCLLSLLLIVLGTNYFQLICFNGTLLTHNYLFSLYAILVFYVIKWNENKNMRYAVFIGVLCGLITLIRPTEGICLLIPALWPAISEGNYLKAKWNQVIQNFTQFSVILLFSVITFSPQLFYWKYSSGDFFHYSYINAGEGLDFLSPHTYNFLFSFRKGWFIYTPLVIIALLGLFQFNKQFKHLGYVIAFVVVADVYVVSSWTSWWYSGASFSSRAILPMLVLLAIPLGQIIDLITRSTRKFKLIVTSVFLFILSLNLFQTWQYLNGIISKERMTYEYFKMIFGKTQVKPEWADLLLVDRYIDETYIPNKTQYKRDTLYRHNFTQKNDSGDINYTLILKASNQYSIGITLPFDSLTSTDHCWLETETRFFAHSEQALPIIVFTAYHKGNLYKYKTVKPHIEDIQFGAWNYFNAFYLSPEVRKPSDSLSTYLWYPDSDSVMIEYLNIYAYEKRK